MTINLANNNPRANYIATSGQTAFTIPFDYFDDSDINVYQNGTLKTITTHYTISGSTVTLLTGATVGDKIAITRDVPLERTTDLTSTYSATSINDQLDTIVAQIADLDDRVSRSISLNDYEVGVSLNLPATADRLGKTIQFNSSDGSLEVGPSGDELTSIASIASQITALEGISSNITTVAGSISNVNSVGGSISAVNSVAGALSPIGSLYSNITRIITISNSITDVNDVADSIDQVELVATSISNVDIVGPAISNVNTAASNISNINTVAGISSNITTVAGITSAISTVNSNASDITIVSNNIDDVNDVANVITKVTTVADNIANVNTLSSQASNIGTLAGISGSINSLGGISSDITTLAAVASDIGNAATNAASALSAKNAAEAARDATLAAYDSFDDRYLGAKSTEPTLDNDSNPLSAGSLYFDNNSNTMKLYNGSAWVAAYISGNDYLALSGGTLTGQVNTTANITFGDNDKAIFGAGSDLQIYHDGTHSYIKDNGTGNLLIQGSAAIVLEDPDGNNMIYAEDGGPVYLYSNGSQKLATTSTGIDVSGTVTADGLNVEIVDNDAGPVTIQQGGNSYFKIVTTNASESVQLGNSTTNPDILLGGGNVGIGTSSPSAKLSVTGLAMNSASSGVELEGAWPWLKFKDTEANQDSWLQYIDGSNFILKQIDYDDRNSAPSTVGTERMRISSGGDISFYEDTGTTAKFFWDASAESLGIGTSSPATLGGGAKLTVNQAADGSIVFARGGSTRQVQLGTTSTTGYINADNTSGGLAFHMNGTERMRIDSSGRVGIGGVPNTNWRNDIADQEVLMLGTEATLFADGGITTELWNNAYVNNSDAFINISTRGASRYLQYQGAHKWFTAASATAGSTITSELNTTPKMILDVSGNLLVGKTSTNYLTNGVEAKPDGSLWATATNNGPFVATRKSSDGNIASFYKDSSFVGSIGSFFGNLMIGKDSGARIAFSSTGIYSSNNSGTTEDASYSLGTASSRFTNLYLSNGVYGNANALKFSTDAGTTQHMTLDTSGNLLVGKTALNTNTTGLQLENDGYLSVCRDGGNVALINRKTSDGAIVTFQKDGATVGSIGVNNSRPYLTNSINCGIRLANNTLVPTNESGANESAATDLGATDVKWKDLYLSGGVYLGGTGAANKLDDYESGTFTYSGSVANLTSLNTSERRYIKIGDQVTLWMKASFDVTAADTRTFISITLPFNTATNTTVISGGGLVEGPSPFKGISAGAGDSSQATSTSGYWSFVPVATGAHTAFLSLTYVAA